jgi:hypothetical protein
MNTEAGIIDPFSSAGTPMRELNPLYNQIKDLRSREEALRGYL